LARTWREIGSTLLRRGRQILPVPVSAGLIAWLVWTISPRRLLDAFAATDWPWLVLATGVQVAVLFLWDTVCVWWLFSQPDRRLAFRTVLRLCCDTVIWSAINLEVGQAAFAWRLAEALGVPVKNTLGYCVLLALFDTGTMLSLALAGSFVFATPVTAHLRWVCVAGLAGLGLLAAAVKFLPERWRGWLAGAQWAGWLAWLDWRAAWKLWALRLTMFLLVMVYAGAGLAICRVPVDVRTVVGVIPFVFVAESLPGTAGLGQRETALVYLYPGGAEHRAILLSFGLIWSTVVISARVLIGLVSWCVPHAPTSAATPRFAASAGPSPPAAGRA
jgi:hypothetical protein